MSEKDTNQQLTINQPALAPAAPEKALATNIIVADTTALAKVSGNISRAVPETIPSNWEITPDEEDTIVCYNIRTGRTFKGTMKEFNTEFFK